jgi:hypothetical protein
VWSAGINALQVVVVLAGFESQHLIEMRLVLPLKDGGILALLLLAVFILPILSHLVDEEQS